jgi:hypothetical protein
MQRSTRGGGTLYLANVPHVNGDSESRPCWMHKLQMMSESRIHFAAGIEDSQPTVLSNDSLSPRPPEQAAVLKTTPFEVCLAAPLCIAVPALTKHRPC